MRKQIRIRLPKMMRIRADQNPDSKHCFTKYTCEQMTKFSVYMPGMATDENKWMVRRIVNMFFIVGVEHCGDSVRGPRLLVHNNQLILSRLECLSRP
jgi:hypothetical protein